MALTILEPGIEAERLQERDEQRNPFAADLAAAIRGEVASDAVTRGVHATDASHYQIVPTAVAWPRDSDDVVAALRVAQRHGVPVTARGAGTSLSGQTHGTGLVLDLSRHMDRVLHVDPGARTATVQAGAILQHLNQCAAPHDLLFAPDPATGSRATVGGMIGNNSSGTRSVRWGRTSDNILALKVALADGTVLDLQRLDDDAWMAAGERAGREGEIYRGVSELVREQEAEIRQRFPKVLRRVAGYALDELVPGGTGAQQPSALEPRRGRSLADLLAGSEGTLAVLLEAKLHLVRKPAATAVCVVHFDDVVESLRHLPRFLEFEPLAVEMLDDIILEEALRNAATKRHAGWFVGSPKAIQICEFDGFNARDARERAQAFAAALEADGIGTARPVLVEPQEQRDAWEVRRLGLGLISNVTGPRKGQAFIEDACVPLEHLAEYTRQVVDLCREEGVPVSVYGHASVGVLHIRPMIDLHLSEDVERMRRIAERCFDWVREYGGAWSGEHGDGLVRGEFLQRYFGDELTGAFREVKRLFDPEGRLNPGKMIDPAPMTENLRYQVPGYGESTQRAEQAASFAHRDQGGFALAVEQCNGVGACRKISSGIMCPSYMATRDERHSTRGRANALRLAMSGQLGDPLEALASDELDEVLKLCLACKACKSECPNAVDMARLKADAQKLRLDRHGVPLGTRAISALPALARWVAGPLAPLVNVVQGSSAFRFGPQRLLGLSPHRRLPPFAARPLRRRRMTPSITTGHSLVLFADTTSRFYEPQIAERAFELLQRLGYRVEVCFAGDAQRPRISKGLLEPARRDGRRVFELLDAAVRDLEREQEPGSVDGRGEAGSGRGCEVPIVCLEPSDASSLAEDLPDLLEESDLVAGVARRIRLFDQIVFADGNVERLAADARAIFWHRHCHERSVFGVTSPKAIGGVHVIDSQAGCCGMAGSFGYEHADLSERIAEDRLLPNLRRALDVHGDGLVVVANGFSCRHQLLDLAADELGRVPVRHLSEVLGVARC